VGWAYVFGDLQEEPEFSGDKMIAFNKDHEFIDIAALQLEIANIGFSTRSSLEGQVIHPECWLFDLI
jgi:hypothetical protein